MHSVQLLMFYCATVYVLLCNCLCATVQLLMCQCTTTYVPLCNWLDNPLETHKNDKID